MTYNQKISKISEELSSDFGSTYSDNKILEVAMKMYDQLGDDYYKADYDYIESLMCEADYYLDEIISNNPWEVFNDYVLDQPSHCYDDFELDENYPTIH